MRNGFEGGFGTLEIRIKEFQISLLACGIDPSVGNGCIHEANRLGLPDLLVLGLRTRCSISEFLIFTC